MSRLCADTDARAPEFSWRPAVLKVKLSRWNAAILFCGDTADIAGAQEHRERWRGVTGAAEAPVGISGAADGVGRACLARKALRRNLFARSAMVACGGDEFETFWLGGARGFHVPPTELHAELPPECAEDALAWLDDFARLRRRRSAGFRVVASCTLRRVDAELREELALSNVHVVHVEAGSPSSQLHRLLRRMQDAEQCRQRCWRQSVGIIAGDFNSLAMLGRANSTPALWAFLCVSS